MLPLLPEGSIVELPVKLQPRKQGIFLLPGWVYAKGDVPGDDLLHDDYNYSMV